MRLLITGSRHLNRKHEDHVYAALDEAVKNYKYENGGLTDNEEKNTLIHGDARGADRMCAQWAEENGWAVESYPAQWEEYGRSAGYIRNQKMVDSGADLCVAFPLGDSFGTRNCIKIAKKAGIPTHVYEMGDFDRETLF